MFPPRWPITFLRSVRLSVLPWVPAWSRLWAPRLWSPSPQLKQSMDFGGLKHDRYEDNRKSNFSPCLWALCSSIYASVFLKVDKTNYLIYTHLKFHTENRKVYSSCALFVFHCYMSFVGKCKREGEIWNCPSSPFYFDQSWWRKKAVILI